MNDVDEDPIDYREDVVSERKAQNLTISESAEAYVRTLFNLGDPRINGKGVDAIDRSFSPAIHYEIKTGSMHVNILDTQFHYQEGAGRSYFIMVKRENRLNGFNLEDSLLFNFGDIYILPMEIIIENYIVQRARPLAEKDRGVIEDGGKQRWGKYKNFINLYKAKKCYVKKELKKVIERRKNGEEISYEERNRVSMSFGRLRQLVTGCGPGYLEIRDSIAYKNNDTWKVINGPYVDLSKKNISKIFIRDVDDKVISDLEKRISKDKINKVNEIKGKRLMLYDEIKEKEKDFGWSLEDDSDLLARLNALKKWQYYKHDLFTSLEEELPF